MSPFVRQNTSGFSINGIWWKYFCGVVRHTTDWAKLLFVELR